MHYLHESLHSALAVFSGIKGSRELFIVEISRVMIIIVRSRWLGVIFIQIRITGDIE